jgi:hypothetical protein
MKTILFTVLYPCEKRLSLRADVSKLMTQEDFLEQVFAWFNAGSNRECEAFLSERMRSLSVNDFVCVDGCWWQCASVGWRRCAGAYVEDICDRVNKATKLDRSAWSTLDQVMRDYRKEKGLTILD